MEDEIKGDFARRVFGQFAVQVLACLITLTLVTTETIGYSIGSKPVTILFFVLGFLMTIVASCMRSKKPIDAKVAMAMWVVQTICFSVAVASFSAMKIATWN